MTETAMKSDTAETSSPSDDVAEVRLLFFLRPQKAQIDRLRDLAERSVAYGVLSAVPEFVVKDSPKPNFVDLVVVCRERDANFWMGFLTGLRFSVEFPAYTVGVRG
jgi:hypothetical protein